jgi:hypothetical protein
MHRLYAPITMTSIEERIKEVYERKLGREISEAEVLEIARWYRQFAELILKWSQDDSFPRSLVSSRR